MAREAFIPNVFKAPKLEIIGQANAILEEYAEQGLSMTLRQLYYQFVSRDLIENTMRSYKRLGNIVSDGRMAGLIDWTMLEDRTRNLYGVPTWETREDFLRSMVYRYHVDPWEGQDVRFEVWIEKEALSGVIARVCDELYVDYFACKGYVSQSEQYTAAQRLEDYRDRDLRVIVLHLGDHDPSGIDMTRDIADRIDMFSHYAGVEVRRIALNMDQVEEYDPPPNPAKFTDSRIGNYVAEYGTESWELDALNPSVLQDLIRDEVLAERDEGIHEQRMEVEKEGREELRKVAQRWSEVLGFLEGEES